VLQKLRQALDGSLDKKIGGRLRQLGSSLLDQHHDGVTQLGKLREKATEMEKKVEEKLAGSETAGEGGITKYLPKGELGLQLCKGRIKTALSGVTKYSQASACRTLCRVVSFKHSRIELTKHENELVYLQERLEKLAEGAPTALTWLDFSQGFEAMLQASESSEHDQHTTKI
jgi:hypothetical protein